LVNPHVLWLSCKWTMLFRDQFASGGRVDASFVRSKAQSLFSHTHAALIPTIFRTVQATSQNTTPRNSVRSGLSSLVVLKGNATLYSNIAPSPHGNVSRLLSEWFWNSRSPSIRNYEQHWRTPLGTLLAFERFKL
jgi:hypothetical protein